jgi:hypothetical protein
MSDPDYRYGVYDNTSLSLYGIYSAEEVFYTVADALYYVGDLIESDSDLNQRFSVQVSRYSTKHDAWIPVDNTHPIDIDGRYFTTLETFTDVAEY